MIVFGDGKHAINTIREDGRGTPKNILQIDVDRGLGYVGKVKEIDHVEMKVDLNLLDQNKNNVLLKFKNPESVRSVIDALKEIEQSLTPDQ